MASGNHAYSFTLIDGAGNSRPLDLVDGVVTAPTEAGEYTLYASYTEYGTTYYSNGIDFTVKKQEPRWVYYQDTKTLVIYNGDSLPSGYGTRPVNGGLLIPELTRQDTQSRDEKGRCGWEAYRGEMETAAVANNVTLPETYNTAFWFYNACNLTSLVGFDKLNVCNVTDMSGMFYFCMPLNDISALAGWDTGSVTNMSSMFYACLSIEDISALTDWNTSSVTNMSGMFEGCDSLKSLSGLEEWDVGSVTNMQSMFNGADVYDVSALARWDTSHVSDMGAMFASTSITDLSALANWNVEKVTNVYNMFTKCKMLTDISGLAEWKLRSLTSMEQMFYECSSLRTIDGLENWDVSNIDNASIMFGGCISVENWSVLNGWGDHFAPLWNKWNIRNMFDRCNGPLPSWAT